MKNLIIFFSIVFHSFTFAQSRGLGLRVAPESVKILASINEGAALSEHGLSFPCSESDCKVIVNRNIDPEIDARLVDHPIFNQLLALRIHGGSQRLQSALYEQLGKHTVTKDFQERFNERVLKFETIKFRCVQSREEVPLYECWIVIGASVLILP
jgi:hypothetical protein